MTATTIRVQMAQRKDTAANWTAANPILLSGEIGYETDTKKFKIGNGSTNWNSLAYLPIPDGSGNLTITGNLEIGSTGSLTFEGSTADGFETTLAVTNPTADRTITLPDRSGTVITSGDTGTITSTMLADGTIVDADVSATAEIAVSKLANGTANQVIVTDGTNVSWSDDLTLAGNLTVNGTTTTINTQDLLVEDKNIIIGNVDTPTDVTADGGGITLKGATDKTINWVDSTDAWTSSERFSIPLGSAAAPTLTFTGDTNTGIYSPGADQVAISTNGSERLRITSAGLVGVGASVPDIFSRGHAQIIGISSASGSSYVQINGASGSRGGIELGAGAVRYGSIAAEATSVDLGTNAAIPLNLYTNNVNRATVDSSGRILVGTSTSATTALLQIRGNSAAATNPGTLYLYPNYAPASLGSGDVLGRLQAGANDGSVGATIDFVGDAAWGSADYPTRLVFSTTADGASSPTERMRIRNNGDIWFNQTSSTNPAVDNVAGAAITTDGMGAFSNQGAPGLRVNRKADDGDLAQFYQDGTVEGSISVSGTTVSYNGAHLSRWSQLPSGAARTEILRGTVLSNIDEMCEWGEEENEQLNRMKVSEVEGDKNVSGVFQTWDDDDDTYTNDFYCAMTGDFIIRIAEGVTVDRGDLLMSAGDGTAKPQDDDIIRSKTIAKVTSTNVSCTYEDGSYCVPCVLMAC